MNDTQNTIAIATQVSGSSPDIGFDNNMPTEIIKKVIESERAYLWDYEDMYAKHNSINDNNKLADGLSDLSEHVEPQL